MTRRVSRLWPAVLAGALAALIAVSLWFTLTPTRYDDPFGDFEAQAPGSGQTVAAEQGENLEAFLRFVVRDIQGYWAREFERAGVPYVPAQVVAFVGPAQSPCGPANADTGPYYCLLDRRIYLDLQFFEVLASHFRAPGDFAQAYVLAHEVGHHVQNLAGVSAQAQGFVREGAAPPNLVSIAQELQADCLAGVWAHSTYDRGLLERGDLAEAHRAAAAVGDDRIQKRSTGRVNPETWTHGSAEQRREWLTRGFTEGDPGACDTFSQIL